MSEKVKNAPPNDPWYYHVLIFVLGFFYYVFIQLPTEAKKGNIVSFILLNTMIILAIFCALSVHYSNTNERIEWYQIQGVYVGEPNEVSDRVVDEFISSQRFWKDQEWKVSRHLSNNIQMAGDISKQIITRYTVSPSEGVYYEVDVVCFMVKQDEFDCRNKEVS